jgi:hypothetical protein
VCTVEEQSAPNDTMAPTVYSQASWSRRRAAILSFPLFDGYATYGGASELIATSSQDDDKSSSSSSSSPSQGGGGGGLFSWVAKPWTEAGRKLFHLH